MSPVLKVRVVKGEELVVRDFRSSDPYVILTLGKHVHRTRVMKDNLNPVWNEEFTFPVENKNDCLLSVEVWDNDAFGLDDKMGNATMDLKPLLEENIKDKKVVSPCKENCLYRDSSIKRVQGPPGTKVQEACLKLRNAESGILTLKFELPA
ncbi:hypothetical protein SUGI_0276930 [Cryptomeria japonica]|uniref:protein C2-DOMAIN ABA-RELATED 11 n=1 Tax=Cryptomeria japonica TaxID=3369 RepID=UPI0024089A29|nr:protein C2-DOMAIN ABA-RELATED 11 [Cryptomeria japonica]GLJ16351.1 hypothetical protein SUGI_0276930 [Cryptomeria japonica]